MGLQQSVTGNYITIYQGKFSKRVPEGTEGAIERVNKKGKTVYEMFYDSLVGKLVGIRTQDGSYGKNWIFEIQDSGGEIFLLQLSYSNSYANKFLKMLPNIDVAQEMKISPQMTIEGKKTITALFVNQNGQAIKHFYTKDVPKDLPQWVKIKVSGEEVWDSTEQVEFLEAMVNKDIIPKLPVKEVPDNQKDLLAQPSVEEDIPDTNTVPLEEEDF